VGWTILVDAVCGVCDGGCDAGLARVSYSQLKRIVSDLGDEDSKLYKTVKGIKHGINIAQDIVKGCNDIVQWIVAAGS